MPLIDLKTDLKSLKYGADRPGGGDSGQPYIKVDINTVDRGFNRLRMTKFDDGLVRGGTVGAINASVVDTLRVGKFLKDFPKGPLFIVKQVGLQLSNPQLEHKTNFPTNKPTRGQGLIGNIGNFIANTANKILNAVGPTRIYNLGINTLAQVPVNAFGQHIVRHGFTPKRNDDNLYFKVALHNNNEGNNRLTQLRSILGNTNDIANYISGPSSVYGIGKTIIRRRGDFIDLESDITATQWATTGSFELSKDKASIAASSLLINNYLGSSKQTVSLLSSGSLSVPPPNSIFPIERYPSSSDKDNIYQIDPIFNVEKDLGLSNLTTIKNDANTDIPIDINSINNAIKQNVISYTNPTLKKYSELRSQVNNAVSSKRKKEVNINRNADASVNFKYVGDLFKVTEFERKNDRVVAEDSLALQFTPLDPFSPTHSPLTKLSFLGYITDFSENYNSGWNSVKYIGRAENFYIFNEFKREVRVGFNIPCFNATELRDKHCKLSELASTLAGKYQAPGTPSSGQLLGGIITILRLGQYVDNQPGIINNLEFSPVEGSTWDLDERLAFYLKVSFSFTVIHNFLPQYYKCGFIFREPDQTPNFIEEDFPPDVTPTPNPNPARLERARLDNPRDTTYAVASDRDRVRQRAEIEARKLRQ